MQLPQSTALGVGVIGLGQLGIVDTTVLVLVVEQQIGLLVEL